MLVLDRNAVRQALPMAQAIDAVADAFSELSKGRAVAPLRPIVDVGPGILLAMPGYVRKAGALALKAVTIFPDNPAQGLERVQAAVLVMDAQTGAPKALLEGSELTAVRTGAASGAATRLLARQDSRTLAVFGSGPQARTQVLAVAQVRPVDRVRVYARDVEHRAAFCEALSKETGLVVKAATSSRQCIDGADIVCTATNSETPVFQGRHLAAGVHVNAVGSYRPQMCELDLDTLRGASKVVVDTIEAALIEAGELVAAREAGFLDVDTIYAEIGQLTSGSKPGREDDKERTVFKSVGNAVQDAACAQLALRNALDMGLGTHVPF